MTPQEQKPAHEAYKVDELERRFRNLYQRIGDVLSVPIKNTAQLGLPEKLASKATFHYGPAVSQEHPKDVDITIHDMVGSGRSYQLDIRDFGKESPTQQVWIRELPLFLGANPDTDQLARGETIVQSGEFILDALSRMRCDRVSFPL